MPCCPKTLGHLSSQKYSHGHMEHSSTRRYSASELHSFCNPP